MQNSLVSRIFTENTVKMKEMLKTPIVIYAEITPNPASMKFVADRMLINNGMTLQYLSPSETKGSPLAARLFQFPFIKGVFISSNFVTITINDSVAWEDVTMELRDFLTNFISEGNEIMKEIPQSENQFSGAAEHVLPVTEDEQKIVDILDEYIRPAVEQDGGLITFKSFKDGIVTVVLKGSCSGCPSSTLTLKAGIEGLLKRMVPEVKEVVSEAM